jgi:UDPglucose 6-dehydrogenase
MKLQKAMDSQLDLNSKLRWFWWFLFPEDLLNLVYIAKSYGLHQVADYWEQVIIMNDHQRLFQPYCQTYNNVIRQKITFFRWGLLKKILMTRESAAIYIADDLVNEHAKLRFMILKYP